MSFLHSNPKLIFPAANPNGKFPMRQTRALPARLTAKTLEAAPAKSLGLPGLPFETWETTNLDGYAAVNFSFSTP